VSKSDFISKMFRDDPDRQRRIEQRLSDISVVLQRVVYAAPPDIKDAVEKVTDEVFEHALERLLPDEPKVRASMRGQQQRGE